MGRQFPFPARLLPRVWYGTIQDLSLTKYVDDLTKKLAGGRFTTLRELIELSRRSNADLEP
eukprot:52537-Pyramimonas_sp.AAC.1